jgi:hypothetical protein
VLNTYAPRRFIGKEQHASVELAVVDRLHTSPAQFIVRHLRDPRSLLRAAWGWLAAETDNLNEERRCLEAILELDPAKERAAMALLWVLQQQQAIANRHPANVEKLATIAMATRPPLATDQRGTTPPTKSAASMHSLPITSWPFVTTCWC